ncbi:PH domain-containing protein [Microbacterium dauci]|uniref:PH domain-containing protein n=1 Tax=Microbacterium dauci TaxID=3048008 RepID=A0ABT6ZCH8_9MICO|nr:PH domain-containing protein [Microbacterium sp. LX3-4]MDJ1113855.1 PH domain-containing protein [Microbacterium sp. LX3-4]
MTSNPDPMSPDSASPTSTDASQAVADEPRAVADKPQSDTFPQLVEPRHPNRLSIGDSAWHQISPKYVLSQVLGYLFWLAVVAAATLVLVLVMEQDWAWIPGGIAFVVFLLPMLFVPRQARSIGYQLREDDLVFRRGILWQRMVAVPYGRLQLVDITHGPLDRGLGIAQLKLVTAAAATGVTIPGLPQADAEWLRDALIEVAETRRTGL